MPRYRRLGLSLSPEREPFVRLTMGDQTVWVEVRETGACGGKVRVLLHAPREVRIVRGTVLRRMGEAGSPDEEASNGHEH